MALTRQSRICRQCGQRKSREFFRQSKSTGEPIPMCKECESLNTARRKIEAKKKKGIELTAAETQRLEDIYTVYDHLRTMGLRPPEVGKVQQECFVDATLEKLKALTPADIESTEEHIHITVDMIRPEDRNPAYVFNDSSGAAIMDAGEGSDEESIDGDIPAPLGISAASEACRTTSSSAALNKLDLDYWLTCPLQGNPDYYYDVVYEMLKEAARPDEKDKLETILGRFEDYMDNYDYENE